MGSVQLDLHLSSSETPSLSTLQNQDKAHCSNAYRFKLAQVDRELNLVRLLADIPWALLDQPDFLSQHLLLYQALNLYEWLVDIQVLRDGALSG